MIPKHRFDEVNKKLQEMERSQRDREAAQQAAADKELAERAEWQKLAESRKVKIEELSAQAELATRLSELVLTQYAEEIKGWPDQVKAMAPADEADVLAKLDWMRRARPLAQELLADKTPSAGNSRRPPPAGPANSQKDEEKALADWRQAAARRFR
jgi:hypothetical protein